MTDGYDWRHGWVPLTWRAALAKAHGNHAQAERLLEEHHARRAEKREAGAPLTPHPVHRAEHQVRTVLRNMSDDQLAAAMGAEDVTDDEVDVLVAELDRRDRAEKKAAAERARRARTRAARDEERETDYDRRCEAGEDPEEAYRAAYGVDEERQRREEAVASLRSAGYSGRGLDQLTRAAFRDHAETTYWAAEAATRGHLLNKAGQAAGVHPRTLFEGPESRARKYASEELLNFWQDHGRLTADDFRAAVLGGHMRHKGAAAWA